MWVERLSHPTHVETIVQWAVQEGRHRIAVWGGDGTLSRVVNALHALNAFDKVTLALIPVGTCNDFARKLSIPGWEKWVRWGFQNVAAESQYDVGLLSTEAGEKTFLNNAGFGRTAVRVRRKSNPAADILSFTPKKVDLEWESNGTRHFETRSVLLGVVCNAPFFNGAMHFDEQDVDPTDGLLNAFFEIPQSAVSLFFKFFKTRLGFKLFDRHTFRIDAKMIHVSSSEELVPQVDGEPASEFPMKDLQFSILPQKLRFASWASK